MIGFIFLQTMELLSKFKGKLLSARQAEEGGEGGREKDRVEEKAPSW